LHDIKTIENMNYLFLETLMCSREKLFLSYVAQDLIKDETIMPSSTWQQLHAYASNLLDPAALGFESYPVTQIPLDPVTTAARAPEPLQAQWLTNHSPLDHQKALRSHQQQQAFGPSHDEVFQDNQAISNPDGTTDGSVQDLVRLLENPLLAYVDQMGAAKQLIDDELNTEHEPFALDGLSRHHLFDASMKSLLGHLHASAMPNLAEVLQHQFQQMASQSQLPIQLFADLSSFNIQDHDSLVTLIKDLRSLQPLVGPVVFGKGWHDQTAAKQLPPLTLKVAESNHQIHAAWEGLYSRDGVICHQVVVSSSTHKPWHKVLLKPFLCWCMAQLDDDLSVAEDFQLSVVFRDQVKNFTWRRWAGEGLSFNSQPAIKAYLTELLLGLRQPQPINVPFEAIGRMKVLHNDRPLLIPYLKPSSRAKSVHVFALDPKSLASQELSALQQSYQSKAENWIEDKAYFELFKAINWHFDADALSTYRQRLLPLHVMAGAEGL